MYDIDSINSDQIVTPLDRLLLHRGRLARGSRPLGVYSIGEARARASSQTQFVRTPRKPRVIGLAAMATVAWLAVVFALVA